MLLRNSKDGKHLKKAARTRLDNVTVTDRLSMLGEEGSGAGSAAYQP